MSAGLEHQVDLRVNARPTPVSCALKVEFDNRGSASGAAVAVGNVVGRVPALWGQAVALRAEPPSLSRRLAPSGFHPSRNTVRPAMPALTKTAALPVAGGRRS